MSTNQPFLLDPRNQGIINGTQRFKDNPLKQITGYLMIGFMLLFLLFGLLIGGFMLSSLWQEWSEQSQLAQAGVETRATVLERREVSDEDGTRFYVRYEYTHTPADGERRSYTDEDRVGADLYQWAEPGTVINIRYVPAAPELAVPVGAETSPMEIMPMIIMVLFMGTAFVGLPIGLIYQGYRWMRTSRVLEERGRLIMGETISSKGYTDSDDDYQVTLRYCFQSPTTGKRIEGKDYGQRNTLKGVPLPEPGAPLAIMYADDHTYRVL